MAAGLPRADAVVLFCMVAMAVVVQWCRGVVVLKWGLCSSFFSADSRGGGFQFSDLMSTMDVEDSEDSGII